MRRTRSENASFVIQAVRALGIEPHAQSRLMQMHRVLIEQNGTISPNEPRIEIALEAERDMQLLGFVFDHAASHGDNTTFRATVARALDDSVLPQNSGQRSAGRDAQMEIFVAAVCLAAGLDPVEYQEPDIICTVDSVRFCIAAKRIKTAQKLVRRVKEARDQIDRVGLPGIVAIDTCVALNPRNDRIGQPIAEEQFRFLYRLALNQFMHHFHDEIQRTVSGSLIRGLVFHDHQVRFEPSGEWGLASMTYWLCTAGSGGQAQQQFASFRDNYVRGLPNLQQLCSSE